MKPTITLCLALSALSLTAIADEGMWTFHAPPKQVLADRYGFDLTDDWLDHVRLSSVRFGRGGSGSFVSPTGLVLTNHHVGLSAIQKLSSGDEDLVRDGFYARELGEERRVPDLELNVLTQMTNITDRVQGAVSEGALPDDAAKQRRAEMSAIEMEAKDGSDLKAEIVSLYRGGEYWLYQYEVYDDVRLVFAPEAEVGFFGGDPDNFTYPRFNLDFALFRVWSDDGPAETPNYLQFNPTGVEDGDLVFVSGHPGRTERLMTMAQIQRLRDRSRPRSLNTIARLSQALREYAATGPEQKRQVHDTLMSIENARKAYTGQLEGLSDIALMARKEAEETELREAVARDAALQEEVGDAWGSIESSLVAINAVDDGQYYSRIRGDMFPLALRLVRYASETSKPNAERLPEYRDSRIEAFKRGLTSDIPIHQEMEETMVLASLELAAENLPPDDPFLAGVLNGRSPTVAANNLVSDTKIANASFRKKLLDGGPEAITASDDPLLVAARNIDPLLRELRDRSESLSTEITLASEKIAAARFAVYGNQVYPDATFTLRLTYGIAEGYEEDTTLVPWKTTFYGLYGRNRSFGGKPPFSLPTRVILNEAHVDLSTPLNFVTNCDITGGNSGSPTINRDGELVGLIFDGNIQSLPNDFVFKNSDDRAVSVHAAGILEALSKIYGADPLVNELLGIKR